MNTLIVGNACYRSLYHILVSRLLIKKGKIKAYKAIILLVICKDIKFVRFEVFTAVTMKIAVFWDVAPCSFCVNRRFGGSYRLHL
jgi:hypothetical protein